MHTQVNNEPSSGMFPPQQHILSPVIHMNNSQEILSSILQSTQLSQTGIRSVLDKAMSPDLAGLLRSQLRELSGIESEARILAHQLGWEMKETDLAVRFLLDRRNRRKLRSEESNSSIADLLIQSNTKSRIQGLKALHRYPDRDRIAVLSQKLIDCQTAAVHQLETFL